MSQVLLLTTTADAAQVFARLKNVPGLAPVDIPSGTLYPESPAMTEARFTLSQTQRGYRVEIPDGMRVKAIADALATLDKNAAVAPAPPAPAKKSLAQVEAEAMAALEAERERQDEAHREANAKAEEAWLKDQEDALEELKQRAAADRAAREARKAATAAVRREKLIKKVVSR